MKKLLYLAVAFGLLSLTSCSEKPEDKAGEFNKEILEAQKKGDDALANKLILEALNYRNGLSKEDQEAFDKVYSAIPEINDIMEDPNAELPELADSTYGQNVPEPCEEEQEGGYDDTEEE